MVNTPRSRRTVLAAAAAAAAAATVFVGLGTAHHETAHRRPAENPAADATQAPVVQEGDRVAGVGFVFAPEGGDTRLCQLLVVGTSGPVCQGVAVPLDRLRTANLPGWRVEFGSASSSEVRVEGIYAAGRLRVEKVTSARPDELQLDKLPPPPCDPPPGGWVSMPRSRPAGWQPYASNLEAFLKAHADVYSGVWTTVSDSQDPLDDVIVVGTTGDVTAARTELARYVPANLCVQRVRFSRATLDGVRANLDARLPGVEVTLTPTTDAVKVSVVAYDKPTHDVVRTADAAAVRIFTLLRPVD